ncbi:MAG: PEP-CTERM sorting domain-containing protein, partial [Microcystis sp.]
FNDLHFEVRITSTQPATFTWESVSLGVDANKIIPEPSSILSILALGTLGAASTLKRQLKSSKSTEKETTKVS